MSETLKILVLQESDWIERGPHHHHLFERLSSRGHEVRVIDYEIGWRDRRRAGIVSARRTFLDAHKVIDRGGVTVIRPAFVRLPRLDYVSAFITHTLEIRRQLRDFRPDVVVGFGIVNAAVGLRLARKQGIPFVYFLIDTLHRLVPEQSFRGMAKFIEQSSLRKAPLVLSFTQALRDYTVEMGAAPGRSFVVHLGVDLVRYRSPAGRREVRARYGMSETDFVLLFVGWLYPFSGLKELADAILSRPEGSPEVKLLAIGQGELAAFLSRLAASEDARGRIVLVNWQPYQEIPRYFAAADVGVLPSLKAEVMRDIVPSKVYEYMAAAKPVIATRLPGLVREFGENHGVIFVDTPSQVLSKALELAEAGELEGIGERGRIFVQKFDWEAVTSEFESRLEAFVKGDASSG